MRTTRVLFSVTEVIDGVGKSHMEISWHPEVQAMLEDISPNYAYTDQIIDLAEAIVQDIEEFNSQDTES